MTGILPLTAKIDAAYKQSIYQAGSVVTKIGHYPRGIPKYLQNHYWLCLVHIIQEAG